MQDQIHNQIRRLFGNPLLWVLFVVQIAVLSSSFKSWGMEGITYAVVVSGIITVFVPILWGAMVSQCKKMLDGEPTRLDHLIAPGGYRRARYTETEQEAASLSTIQPTPNRPFIVVDAEPASRAVAPSTNLAPHDRQGARETIIRISPNCMPKINSVLGRAILGVGMRGSGKTNLAALLIEQLGRFPLPMLVCDPEADYVTFFELMRSSNGRMLARCIIGGSPEWDEAYIYEKRYWTITKENAFTIGYNILEKGAQLILQTYSYATKEEAAMVMTQIIRGMFRWASEQDPDARVPCLVFLDEAQHFLPQDSSVSNIEDEAAKGLLKAFMDINALGRKRGFTPAIFTQRIAQIRKEVIAGSEVYFLGLQTLDNDLKRYEEIVGKDDRNKQKLDRQVVRKFSQGDFALFEGGELCFIHCYQRESRHNGNTPKLEQALRRYDTAFEPQLAPVSPETDTERDTGDLEMHTEELGVVHITKKFSLSQEKYLVAKSLRSLAKVTNYREWMDLFEISEHYAKALDERIKHDLEMV